MTFEVGEEEAGVLLAFDGVLDADEVLAGFAALGETAFGGAVRALVIDVCGVQRVDISVAESHHLIRTFRSLIPVGPHLRLAVVAGRENLREAERHFLIRDTLTGRSPAELPRLESFETLEEARAWLAEAE